MFQLGFYLQYAHRTQTEEKICNKNIPSQTPRSGQFVAPQATTIAGLSCIFSDCELPAKECSGNKTACEFKVASERRREIG